LVPLPDARGRHRAAINGRVRADLETSSPISTVPSEASADKLGI